MVDGGYHDGCACVLFLRALKYHGGNVKKQQYISTLKYIEYYIHTEILTFSNLIMYNTDNI